MITYNEINFFRKTSLIKKLTFPSKVKSKSIHYKFNGDKNDNL